MLNTTSQHYLSSLASGRKVVNLCIFFWFIAGTFHVFDSLLGPLFVVIVLIVGIIGSVRLIFSLQMSRLSRAVFLICSLLPLVNLIPMYLLGSRAAKALKSEGYEIGMFEARVSGAI